MAHKHPSVNLFSQPFHSFSCLTSLPHASLIFSWPSDDNFWPLNDRKSWWKNKSCDEESHLRRELRPSRFSFFSLLWWVTCFEESALMWTLKRLPHKTKNNKKTALFISLFHVNAFKKESMHAWTLLSVRAWEEKRGRVGKGFLLLWLAQWLAKS